MPELSGEKNALRDQFLLDPGVVYLNHGSFGACPRPVFESYQAWQLELERQPVAFMRRVGAEVGQARRALGAYLGADADNLVYVPNATMGLNIVARSLDLQPGDEIVGTDHEYGAIERAWRFVCAKQGARYVRQHVPLPLASVEQVVEAIWAGVTERTRALFFSHITSPTALILPVVELVRRAREVGILTVIDGAHAPGQIDLHLEALGADFYAGNCHKWMMTPKGSGFLYARPEAQALLEPLVVSWGWGNDAPRVTCFVDEQQNQGTRDMAAFLAVPAAIHFMEQHHWPAVRRDCHTLLRYARHKIDALGGPAPATPDDPRWFAQMASLPLPSCDTGALCQRLRDEYGIEVPIVRWAGANGEEPRCFVRLSVQGYNTQDDIDRLLLALETLLPEVTQAEEPGF
jgi:isopenicillin-N epimerase